VRGEARAVAGREVFEPGDLCGGVGADHEVGIAIAVEIGGDQAVGKRDGG
jgi:hypothetical protein